MLIQRLTLCLAMLLPCLLVLTTPVLAQGALPYLTPEQIVSAIPSNLQGFTFNGSADAERAGRYDGRFVNDQTGETLLLHVRASNDPNIQDGGAVYVWQAVEGRRKMGDTQMLYNYQGIPFVVEQATKSDGQQQMQVIILKLFPNNFAELNLTLHPASYTTGYYILQLWHANLLKIPTQNKPAAGAS